MQTGCSFDLAFFRVWSGESFLNADAVGAKETDGEVHSFKIFQCIGSDQGFGGRFYRSARQIYLMALGSQNSCMGDAVGDIDRMNTCQILQHFTRRRTGIDIDNIGVFY